MSGSSATATGTPRVGLTSRTGPAYSRICGIGDFRPEHLIGNAEIAPRIDSSDEWIRDRSGIHTRRQASADETVATMAAAAGRAALADAGVDADQVGTVIVATLSHPYQTPAAATLVALELGAEHAAAFDLSAACAGFCYAVGVADGLVRAGGSDYVLVIGVEKMSDFRNWDDRGTAFIFGDGAGAVLVGPSEQPAIGPTVWGADGSGFDLIKQSTDWVSFREALENPESTPEQRQWPWIAMEGPSVFRWAAFQMAPIARQALQAAGVDAADLDVFVPHQANVRIIDTLVKQLKLPENVVIAREDVAEMANTSAASVPLALARLVREGRAASGDLCLMIGFGAGLTWAAQVVRLP